MGLEKGGGGLHPAKTFGFVGSEQNATQSNISP